MYPNAGLFNYPYMYTLYKLVI